MKTKPKNSQLPFRYRHSKYCQGFFKVGILLFLGVGARSVERFPFEFSWGQKKAEHLELYDFSRVEGPFDRDSFDSLKSKKFTKNILDYHLLKNLPLPVYRNLSPILSTTLRLAEWYQVDPFWVLAIMWVESHFNQWSKSPLGALGLMQIMPKTGDYLHLMMEDSLLRKSDGLCAEKNPSVYRKDGSAFPYRPNKKLFGPSLNVELGIVYLKCLLRVFNNDSMLATVAYNMGPFRIKQQLTSQFPVGKSNRYLEKVKSAYQKLSLNIEYL